MASYKSYLSVHRRSILSSRFTAGNKEGTREKSEGKASYIIQQTREEYGRYFGICGSYHCLKACICKDCPSYSGGAGMFCSRGKYLGPGKKEGCLCETCELFRKYRLEGKYFCLQNEKSEYVEEKLKFSEEKPEFSLKNCRKALECSGTVRFCVVEEPKT